VIRIDDPRDQPIAYRRERAYGPPDGVIVILISDIASRRSFYLMAKSAIKRANESLYRTLLPRHLAPTKSNINPKATANSLDSSSVVLKCLIDHQGLHQTVHIPITRNALNSIQER
jgi:hypothetical protein